MKKEVWLIRHAESLANAGEITKDVVSIELTQKGWNQAKNLVKVFGDKGPDLIIISPFLRTKQTALHVVNEFSSSNYEEWQIQEFTYLSPKKWSNSSWLQRKRAVDAFWDRNDPNYKDCHDVESFNEFITRVQNFWWKINQCREKFIVVFSHSYFIKTLQWLLENDKICNYSFSSLEMKEIEKFIRNNVVPNTGILKIEIKSQLQLSVKHLEC